MGQNQKTETLELRMNWQQAAGYIAAALEDGTPEGKHMGRKQLADMARAADKAVELQAELNRLKASIRESADKVRKVKDDL